MKIKPRNTIYQRVQEMIWDSNKSFVKIASRRGKDGCQRGRNPRGDASEDEKPVAGDYYAGRLDKILSRMGVRK